MTRAKTIILLQLAMLLLSSCAVRTYRVKESSAFKATPYDMAMDSVEIESYTPGNENEWLGIAQTIIDSTPKEIIKTSDFSMSRDYCAINDSTVLEFFDYKPVGYSKTIVFFIGNSSRHTSYTEYLVELAKHTQARIVSWNYRGYGHSNGKSSFKTQFVDNQAMFTKLGLNKEAGRLTVMGYSLGSVFATDIAVNNNVGQLILLSPVSDVADMLKHYKRAFLSGVKVVLRPFIDLTAKDYLLAISNLEKIKHFPNKLLIFHAKDDADLPYKMGKKLYENALSEKKQFVSVRKGGHAAAFEHQNLLKVVGWINKGV